MATCVVFPEEADSWGAGRKDVVGSAGWEEYKTPPLTCQ